MAFISKLPWEIMHSSPIMVVLHFDSSSKQPLLGSFEWVRDSQLQGAGGTCSAPQQDNKLAGCVLLLCKTSPQKSVLRSNYRLTSTNGGSGIRCLHAFWKPIASLGLQRICYLPVSEGLLSSLKGFTGSQCAYDVRKAPTGLKTAVCCSFVCVCLIFLSVIIMGAQSVCYDLGLTLQTTAEN